MADEGATAEAGAGALSSSAAMDATAQLIADAEARNETEIGDPSPTLKRPKPRKPGQPWDGRYSSLTIEEYRAMKWGADASFNATRRKGPAFSIRGACPTKSKSTTNVLLSSDVSAAIDKVKPAAPGYSMGAQPLPSLFERSQGPAQYTMKCTMQTRGHPDARLGHKHTGYKFGTELQRPPAHNAKNPAPGDYDQEAFKQSAAFRAYPAYTSQGREAWRDSTAAPGPGPGTFEVDGKSRVGKDTPVRYSVALPPPKPRPGVGTASFVTPGPPDYQDPETHQQRVDILCGSLPKWPFSKDVRGLDR